MFLSKHRWSGSEKIKPECPLELSLPRLHHCADSFPVCKVTSLSKILACPQEKFKLLRVVSKAFHLCVLLYSPDSSLPLAQIHTGQYNHGSQSWKHIGSPTELFFPLKQYWSLDCTSIDFGDGPPSSASFKSSHVTLLSNQNGESLFIHSLLLSVIQIWLNLSETLAESQSTPLLPGSPSNLPRCITFFALYLYTSTS